MMRKSQYWDGFGSPSSGNMATRHIEKRQQKSNNTIGTEITNLCKCVLFVTVIVAVGLVILGSFLWLVMIIYRDSPTRYVNVERLKLAWMVLWVTTFSSMTPTSLVEKLDIRKKGILRNAMKMKIVIRTRSFCFATLSSTESFVFCRRLAIN